MKVYKTEVYSLCNLCEYIYLHLRLHKTKSLSIIKNELHEDFGMNLKQHVNSLSLSNFEKDGAHGPPINIHSVSSWLIWAACFALAGRDGTRAKAYIKSADSAQLKKMVQFLLHGRLNGQLARIALHLYLSIFDSQGSFLLLLEFSMANLQLAWMSQSFINPRCMGSLWDNLSHHLSFHGAMR
jgi:hypothetical protein